MNLNNGGVCPQPKVVQEALKVKTGSATKVLPIICGTWSERAGKLYARTSPLCRVVPMKK